MRDLTTNWNASAFYSQTVFVDKTTGNTMTVGANRPVDVRTMFDSVQAGQYTTDPDSVSADPSTVSSEPTDEDVIVVTVETDSDGVGFFPVKAESDDTDVATVSPAVGFTKADGTVEFTITSVADGSATITFTAGTNTDTVAVTVATP
jgi:hypothetical protein